ncbi:response regulator consisting of a CheY-like receiver domain and a winged-helix DNA-binding domain [Microbacterium testaceum StLB037]|uniref:Response regulator consisting of a CheY-like receiver domain and a winged-helix DNA-binding domain n=1 Tax=Microbacterium testaceum (strain StLB037) TaxID=979556 RepID=E8NER6_MICTS|nr:response regulator consisting of a CheY-like receiver domain and a winged-helix DNA-binding domain [Microbacterium testaceum StLB037]
MPDVGAHRDGNTTRHAVYDMQDATQRETTHPERVETTRGMVVRPSDRGVRVKHHLPAVKAMRREVSAA